MIIASLKMIVRPESRGDLLESIKGMLQPARVERGCLNYRFYEDMEDRNAFVLLQEWATQEDLEKHISTDSHRRMLALMDLLSKPPDIRYYTVTQTMGMDMIGNVLKANELK